MTYTYPYKWSSILVTAVFDFFRPSLPMQSLFDIFILISYSYFSLILIFCSRFLEIVRQILKTELNQLNQSPFAWSLKVYPKM